MSKKDFYKVMGVDKKASQDELKKAYRKLARKFHPDVSREHNAEHKFKEVNEAYDTLKDPQKRAEYDVGGNAHSQWRQQQSAAGGWGQQTEGVGDFFENIFSGQTGRPRAEPGQDFETAIDINVTDTVEGGKKTIMIHVPEINQHGDKQLVSKTLSINIPQGVRSKQKIRLKKQGATGSHNGPKGDLYLVVNLVADKPFSLKDDALFIELPLAPWEAVLGCSVKIPTLTGSIELKIKPGTQGGSKLRLKGRGVPANGRSKATDAYVVIQLVTPVNGTKVESFYKKMAETFDFDPREGWDSFR